MRQNFRESLNFANFMNKSFAFSMHIALIVRRLRHWVFTNTSFFAKFVKLLVHETFPLYGNTYTSNMYMHIFNTIASVHVLRMNNEILNKLQELDKTLFGGLC